MKTRLEILCDLHGQKGGTIHQFNADYNVDFINMPNKQFLKTVYCIQLKRAYNQFPDMYSWPSGELVQVMERMCIAINSMSFNKDSPAWVLTCRALGIPHTYKAIKEYLQ